MISGQVNGAIERKDDWIAEVLLLDLGCLDSVLPEWLWELIGSLVLQFPIHEFSFLEQYGENEHLRR